MSDRKKMSLFTNRIERIFVLEKTILQIIFGRFLDIIKQIPKPTKKANHSAINVAHATPSTPHPKRETLWHYL